MAEQEAKKAGGLSGLGIVGMVLGGIAVVAVLAVLIVGGWFIGTRNSLVTEQEQVRGSWGQVENVYQRRADLIPNLVETVKGYATHERETLEAVISARARATQVRVNANDAHSIAEFQQAQGELSSALSRLMVVMEQYPQLRANDLFRDLQAQLEGTENRITVERMRWNENVRTFNTHIQVFPASLVAGMMNLQALPYFEAEEGADRAPRVNFGSAAAPAENQQTGSR